MMKRGINTMFEFRIYKCVMTLIIQHLDHKKLIKYPLFGNTANSSITQRMAVSLQNSSSV